MNEEVAGVVVKEEFVLEKFDGDGDNAVLRERIFVVDQELVKHEFFDENGELENTLEGGNELGSN